MQRFLVPAAAQRGKEEAERELLGKELKIGELGKMTDSGGAEVWAHIAFADCLLELAQEAGIQGKDTYIWQVQDKLPAIIKDRVTSSYANWESFMNALVCFKGCH